MSESLRNDGRIWAPKDPATAAKIRAGELDPNDVPEDARDYYLERKYPSFGNLAPRDISSRAAKELCDAGHGVASTGLGVFLDFRDAIQRDGKQAIEERYGNLFEMYQRITGDDPYSTPMMIFPAVHYTMGGLWVDYNLESTSRSLRRRRGQFSDHGANRLGASALMQAADGYLSCLTRSVITLANRASPLLERSPPSIPPSLKSRTAVKSRLEKLLSIGGTQSPRSFHKRLGKIIWDECGWRAPVKASSSHPTIQALRKEFWSDLRVTGEADGINPELERAGRVADFMEFGELMCRDALMREESCGGHFRIDIKPMTAKLSAMTKTTPSWVYGNIRATPPNLPFTKNPSSTKTSNSRPAVTNRFSKPDPS